MNKVRYTPENARYIPENAEARDFPAASLVAYCYDSERGPAFIAYKGRQSKPARFLAFGSNEHRERSLAELVKQETEREGYKRARRETAHGLEIGDILYNEWGYEQTNVSYFQVLRVPSGRSVVLREIEADRIEDKPMSMSGKSTPKPGEFVASSKEQTRRATGFQRVGSGKDYGGDLQKWDGTPRRVTWYA